jgi:hypothetical protein
VVVELASLKQHTQEPYMIRFLTLAMILLSTLSYGATVDSKRIKSVSAQLAKMLPSSNYRVKAASPLEMMKAFAKDELNYDDFFYDVATATEGDSSAWGIIKMGSVLGWLYSAEIFTVNEEGNEIQHSPKAKKAVDLVKSLNGSGVVFGAGPFGAVQCGFTYPALMIIDTAAGVIYTFETERSGC